MTVRLTTGGTIHGLDAVALENDFLRITVLPQLGGRIWSLIHLPTSRELLWQNPNLPPAVAEYGAGYDSGWAGGWDEVFPSDAPAEIDGVAYPDHGEDLVGTCRPGNHRGLNRAICHQACKHGPRHRRPV